MSLFTTMGMSEFVIITCLEVAHVVMDPEISAKL